MSVTAIPASDSESTPTSAHLCSVTLSSAAVSGTWPPVGQEHAEALEGPGHDARAFGGERLQGVVRAEAEADAVGRRVGPPCRESEACEAGWT